MCLSLHGFICRGPKSIGSGSIPTPIGPPQRMEKIFGCITAGAFRKKPLTRSNNITPGRYGNACRAVIRSSQRGYTIGCVRPVRRGDGDWHEHHPRHIRPHQTRQHRTYSPRRPRRHRCCQRMGAVSSCRAGTSADADAGVGFYDLGGNREGGSRINHGDIT